MDEDRNRKIQTYKQLCENANKCSSLTEEEKRIYSNFNEYGFINTEDIEKVRYIIVKNLLNERNSKECVKGRMEAQEYFPVPNSKEFLQLSPSDQQDIINHYKRIDIVEGHIDDCITYNRERRKVNNFINQVQKERSKSNLRYETAKRAFSVRDISRNLGKIALSTGEFIPSVNLLNTPSIISTSPTRVSPKRTLTKFTETTVSPGRKIRTGTPEIPESPSRSPRKTTVTSSTRKRDKTPEIPQSPTRSQKETIVASTKKTPRKTKKSKKKVEEKAETSEVNPLEKVDKSLIRMFMDSIIGMKPIEEIKKLGDQIKYFNFNMKFEGRKDKNGFTPLHLAVLKNNIDAVKYLIDKKANIDITDEYGRTPICYSTEHKDGIITKLLLDANANLKVNSRDCPLLLGVIFRNRDINLAIRLLKMKISIYYVDDDENINMDPFLMAVSIGDIKLLREFIKAGADINHRYTSMKQTPLMIAIGNKWEKGIESLIKLDANPNIKDKDGQTALDYAKAFGNSDYIDIISGRPRTAKVEGRLRMSDSASARGNTSPGSRRRFVSSDDEDKNREHDEFSIKLLKDILSVEDIDELIKNVITYLKKGADPNYVDETSHNALQYLVMRAKNGLKYPQYGSLEKLLELMTILIDNGADVNKTTPSFRTPLYMSLFYNIEPIAQLLFKRGADINVKNKDDTSYLTDALYKDNMELAQKLMKYGAELYLPYNVDALINAILMNDKKMIDVILENGININSKYLNTLTPLLMGVAANNVTLDTIKYLINKGADINAIDREGSNVLLRTFNRNPENKDVNNEIIEYFLNLGINPNYQNKKGVIALMEAIARRDMNLIKLLMDHNADIYMTNKDNMNAIKYALSKGYVDIGKYILERHLKR